MRAIKRSALSNATLKRLGELQAKVQTDASPRDRARLLWESKPKPAFAEIREALCDMAPGRSRCMYCEDSMGTDIDHFWPKADYPQGTFCWYNYLLACSHCNSNLKREKFPRDEDGKPLLVDPTGEDPATHLLFIPENGEFSPVGVKGDITIEVFGLNDDLPPRRLPTERKRALGILKLLLRDYDRQVRAGDPSADETRAMVIEHPFSSVLTWLLTVIAQPGGEHVIDKTIVRIIKRHRVSTWLH
jgi:hypothetical protein